MSRLPVTSRTNACSQSAIKRPLADAGVGLNVIMYTKFIFMEDYLGGQKMSDSFQYIKKHMDSKELEKQIISDKAKSKQAEERRIDDAKETLWKSYSKMVIEVLTELRDSYYPSFEVRDICWFCVIGKYRMYGADTWGRGLNGEHFTEEVRVELGFDKQFARAIRFNCSRRGGYYKKNWWGRSKYVEFGTVNCGLNRQELVAALTMLHPIESLK